MTLYIHEMKMNIKSLIIWTICVGGLCLGCVLLYTSLQDSLEGMADAYSNMGAMSQAFGMDKMSIATLEGYYATEIGMMHGLGGAMFAAIIGSVMLSKEEMMHTSEFLNTLPISRSRLVIEKYLALVSNIVIFNAVCVILYVLGFVIMGEEIQTKEFMTFHALQLLMHIEIGTICFLISAATRKSMIGAGLGVAVIMFAADIMCRIIPAIEDVKYITPFYYANGSDIFSGADVNIVMIITGFGITVLSVLSGWGIYARKDLAS